jgi:hypothetical protein
MPRAVTSFLILVVVGCCSQHSASAESQPLALPPPTTKPVNAPVAAVWFDVGYPPPPKPGEDVSQFEFRRLIVGVWSDGTVIWSDDRRTGGKPYYVGRIPPELVTRLLTSLNTVGLFDVRFRPPLIVDSSSTVIAAETDAPRQRQQLASSHDPPTTRPLLDVNEHGMSAIAPGEPRPARSAEFTRFMEVWAESRRLIESVVPEAHGKPMNEKLDKAVFDVGREKK